MSRNSPLSLARHDSPPHRKEIAPGIIPGNFKDKTSNEFLQTACPILVMAAWKRNRSVLRILSAGGRHPVHRCWRLYKCRKARPPKPPYMPIDSELAKWLDAFSLVGPSGAEPWFWTGEALTLVTYLDSNGRFAAVGRITEWNYLSKWSCGDSVFFIAERYEFSFT